VVLFAGKDAIQKILIEDDLLKSPDYEWIREDSGVTNLITERDRVAYRQKARSFCRDCKSLLYAC
jgi:hypothetical protein